MLAVESCRIEDVVFLRSLDLALLSAVLAKGKSGKSYYFYVISVAE